MHEGALLLVGSSAKGFCRMRRFDSYCHVLTSGILVFSLCMVENRENISIMSRMLLLSEYFAVIFFKRRNYN